MVVQTITHSSELPVEDHQPLQLLDADGNDVTPRSLLNPSVNLHSNVVPQRDSVAETAPTKGNFGIGTVARQSRALLGGRQKKNRTGNESEESIDMPFSRSFVSSSMVSSQNAKDRSTTMGGMDDDGDTLVSGISDVRTFHTVVKQEQEVVPEEELDNVVDIVLTESDIIWMFDQPSTCVTGGTEDAEAVEALNKHYDTVVNEYQSNHDFCAERFAQTMHLADKNKECQASAVETFSVGCEASESNIFDTYAAVESEEQASEVPAPNVAGGNAVADPLSVGGVPQSESSVGPQTDELTEAEGAARLAALRDVPGFSTVLQLTERIVVHADPQCASHQRLYKRVPVADLSTTTSDAATAVVAPAASGADGSDGSARASSDSAAPQSATGAADANDAAAGAESTAVPEESESEEAAAVVARPRFELLWTYKCALTDGLAVTSTAWNRASPDIIAAGYGALDQDGLTAGGLVCCWSFKNPQ